MIGTFDGNQEPNVNSSLNFDRDAFDRATREHGMILAKEIAEMQPKLERLIEAIEEEISIATRKGNEAAVTKLQKELATVYAKQKSDQEFIDQFLSQSSPESAFGQYKDTQHPS